MCPTSEASVIVTVGGTTHRIPSEGLRATIIDYTLSRMEQGEQNWCITTALHVFVSVGVFVCVCVCEWVWVGGWDPSDVHVVGSMWTRQCGWGHQSRLIKDITAYNTTPTLSGSSLPPVSESPLCRQCT